MEIFPEIDKGKLIEQLVSFGDLWPRMSQKTISEEYQDSDDSESDFSDYDSDEEKYSTL